MKFKWRVTALSRIRKSQRIDLIVPAWGARTSDALNCCVASLLAPGNLPALRGHARLIIATLPANRQAFVDSSILTLAAKFAEVELALIKASAGTAKHSLLSRGHLSGARRAARDKALAMYLCADSLVADGALPRLIAAAQGKRAVLTVPWAISAESARVDMERMRGADGSLVVSARNVARLAAMSPDGQFQQWKMTLPGFVAGEFPYCPWWRVCDDGILVHSLWHQPAVINFAEITQHDTTGLERWTYDGDYASRNATIEQCAILRDSDEYLAAFVRPDLEWQPLGDSNTISPLDALASALGHPMTDDLKRKAFVVPFRIHGSALADERWEAAEEGAAKIISIAKALAGKRRYGGSPPFLLETIGEMNLVAFNGLVFVVPKHLGPVEIDELAELESVGVRQYETIDLARAAISRNRRIRHKPNYVEPPRLLEEIGNMNLVAFNGSVFVIPKRLGPVQLERLTNPKSLGIGRYRTIEGARTAASKADERR